MMHWNYLKYVVRHKWFVLWASWHLGVPWLGLLHDWTKFTPAEWTPYARRFFGPKPTVRNATGGYDPLKTGDPAFSAAWTHHYTHNKHHWQAWVRSFPDDGCTYLEAIPTRYCREMVADWIGAGRAQGKPDTMAWYQANKDTLDVTPGTRKCIEHILDEWTAAQRERRRPVLGKVLA